MKKRYKNNASFKGGPLSNEEISILLKELQITQLELKRQNEELYASSQLLADERTKLDTLYNFAPVSCFILDRFGIIENSNQAASNLLNRHGKQLAGRPFRDLVASEDLEHFNLFFQKLQISSNKESKDIKLVFQDGISYYTRLEGVQIPSNYNNQVHFYITISDVATLSDITFQQSRADHAFRLSSDRQRLIVSAAFDAQEKERQKISTALHDSVCQLLYGVKLNIQSLKKTGDNEFRKIDELINQAITETRDLSYDLTPSVLRDFGFTAGVKEIAQRYSIPDFKITAHVKKDADLLQPNVQLFVFRIMQELLNNCIKHSKSRSAQITVTIKGEWLTLIVSDKGSGFDTTLEHAFVKGSGLRGVKNRVLLLNGLMEIESSDEGTTITVSLNKNLEI